MEITIIDFRNPFYLCSSFGGVLETEKKSDFDVVADILRLATLGSKESEIMVGCDLSRNLMEKYLPALMVLKLVAVQKESMPSYKTTDRGLEFLRFYYGLRWLLWGNDNDFVLINILTKLNKKGQPYYVR